MRAHHVRIQGAKLCLCHDERFGEGEECPECIGEDEAKKIKPKAYCETHDEAFETECPRCAMWKANTLDQDAQETVAAPPAPMLRRESDRDYMGKMPTPSRPVPPMPAIKAPSEPQSALQVQEGGDHYKKLKIQPVEYIHANGLPFAEGSVIKYVTRWRDKNGIADLKKARHFLDLLIELETKAIT
ncbi:SaV-like [uncultured Caudovirales phage]|uniref:SaV-like n=1 Tax=uncultured Caudovirales phage TaxID=2100421 RepID=A0A6J5NVV1_9CAUD|nr:SaV-like [uncultured Caudovirales phage]